MWAPDFPISPARFSFFYGWIIMGAGTLVFIASMPGQTSGVSVFIEYLIINLNLSRVQLSLAYSLGTLFAGLLLPWTGRLYDRYGARKCTVIASVGMGLTLILLSQSDRFAELISFDLIHFNRGIAAFFTIFTGFFLIRIIGQGFFWMMSQNMMGKWFNKKRGLVMAITGVIATLVFSITPKVFDAFIQWWGWRGTWILMGIFMILCLSLIAWIFFRDNPEECDLKMDGQDSPESEDSNNSDMLIVRDFTLKQAFKTYSFWLINLTLSFGAMFTTGYTFHVISIGDELGLNKESILNLFIPIAVVGAFTNFVAGWIADKTRLTYVLILMAASTAVAPAGMLLMRSEVGIIMMILGLGIPNGCWQVLSGVSWPRYFGRLHLGVISGFGASIIVISSSLGPILFSVSKQYLGNYDAIYIFSAIIPTFIAFGGFWMINPQRKIARLNKEGNP